MIKLKDILTELRGGKTLSVFDADDTLVESDHWIFITHADGSKSKLDPAEFAVYDEKPGDVFDFSDFSAKLRNPKAIKKNVALLKKQLDKARKTTARRVVILTARAVGLPIRHFFKTLGMNVEVVAVGSSDPQKKADWIANRIERGYTTVYFMDDSQKNVNAVANLKKKYPDVKIKAVKV
jgi:hypothetical protein